MNPPVIDFTSVNDRIRAAHKQINIRSNIHFLDKIDTNKQDLFGDGARSTLSIFVYSLIGLTRDWAGPSGTRDCPITKPRNFPRFRSPGFRLTF